MRISSEQGATNVKTQDLKLKSIASGPKTNVEAHNVEVDVLESQGDVHFHVKDQLSLGEARLEGILQAKAGKAQVGLTHALGVVIQADSFKATAPIETTQDTFIDVKHVYMKKDASIHAGGKAVVKATESYTDQETTKINGEKGTILYTPKTTQFLGTIGGGSTVELWLKDMRLESILAQVKAPQIEAHLDSDIRVERDLSVTQNLYVFAKSFENKAVILAPAGFVIRMVGHIINTGVMRGEKDLVLLTTGGDVKNVGEASTSGKLGVQGKSIFNKGLLEGGQADVVAKEGSIVSEGGKLAGREYLRAVAAGSIILKETEVSSSKGDIIFEVSDKIHFYAPHVDAFGNITVFGEKGVTVHDVSDVQRTETHTEQKAGSLFGASKKVDFVHASRTSKGAYFASQNGSVTLRSAQGDVFVTNIHVKASQTVLEALNGVVSILQGENEFFTQEHEKKEDLALVKDTIRTKHEVTHSASSFSEGLTVKAKETIVETVKGQALDFLKDIEKTGGILSYKIIENLLDVKEESHTAPTAALSAVVALAASICTAGIGGAIVGAASSAAAAAASAAISGAAASLLTQASLALICCEGDIGKAAQRLASEESLKSMAYSTITAGVTAGISDVLHIPQSASQMKTALDHIERQAVNMGINMTAGIVTGQKLDDAFMRGLKGAAAGVVGGIASSQIGKAYFNQDVNFIGHKFLHALVGGTTGAILSEKPLEGATAGAFGAVTAEVIGELVLINSHKIAGDVANKLKNERIPLTSENIQNAVREELTCKTDFIKLITSGITLITGQDVSIANSTAATAVDHNLSQMASQITELEVFDILERECAGIYNAAKESLLEAADFLIGSGKEMPEGVLPEGDPLTDLAGVAAASGIMKGAKVLQHGLKVGSKLGQAVVHETEEGVSKQIAKTVVHDGEAHSAANRQRLATQLRLEQEGIIDNTGHITEKTIQEAQPIQPGTKMKNTAVQDAMAKKGGPEQWDKVEYKVKDLTPAAQEMHPDLGSVDLHFYRNKEGEILPTHDYKAKANPQYGVREAKQQDIESRLVRALNRDHVRDVLEKKKKESKK